MDILALLLVFPLIWPFVAKAKYKQAITLGEMAANIVLVVAGVCALWFGGRYGQMADQEVLNGQVVSKDSEQVSCTHSYPCNCRQQCTGSGKDQTCTQVCDVCYEHSYDIDWNLRTTVGTISVSRIDRQGTDEPPRWTQGKAGDPVAMSHTHVNYIKGAPDSLFSAVAEKTTLLQFGAQVPDYPLGIYDLHYLNRVLTHGVNIPDLAEWDRDVSLRLRTLGPSKQVNWIIVFSKEDNPAYADALRVKWLGGKKNDVVVVLGTPEFPKLAWARVLSWSDAELFKVQLRDDLLHLPEVTRAGVLDLMEKHTSASFKRKRMVDFEYLKSEIQPPTWLLVLIGILGVMASLGLSYYFANKEPLRFAGRRF